MNESSNRASLSPPASRQCARFCLAALVAWAMAGLATRGAEPARPNIVLILADDLGWGDLGCYGQQKIKTPRIDRLARQGMRFTQHYAGSCVCAPSRCSLLTGLHAGHAPIRGNREVQPEGQFPLPAGLPSLGRVLGESGYRTACIGKWGLGMPGTSGDPNGCGFDHFFGYLCQRKAHSHFPEYLWRNGRQVPLAENAGGQQKTYSHDLLTQEAIEFVRSAGGRPFFLYLAYTIPHLALQVPEDSLAEYRGRWDDRPYDGKKGYRPHPAPRAAYAAMISRLDRDVGRLVDLVDELGLGGNTLILFSSDNGATFDVGGADTPFFRSNGPLRDAKGTLYEGGLRVPLLARWTGKVPPGTTSDHVCAGYDFLPTCADLVGARPPRGDGLSYLPALLGQAQLRHDFLYWEIAEGRRQQAVRSGAWKAVRTVATGKTELFNLDADLAEAHDLSAAEPERLRQLGAIMEREHVESAEFPLRAAKR